MNEEQIRENKQQKIIRKKERNKNEKENQRKWQTQSATHEIRIERKNYFGLSVLWNSMFVIAMKKCSFFQLFILL